jgi:spore maturation protein CgeB
MVGDHEDVFCLKGRDFEIPISGGLYLTQFHPELGNVYDIGKEIICYQGLDDMVAKIRHYLERPEKAEEIRKAGYQRAVKEHTWVQRFRRAFEAMGLLK